MLWDLFCRVVDNFGDIGVCWRLAADLGARGQDVRLWIDDPAPLSWLAPHGAARVHWQPWTPDTEWPEPGEVVVEAFGCDPPPAFVARMARQLRPPVWINLEYLSAEAYVTRSHGLRSPRGAGPGQGLDKWFFYPGFVPGTGGLIREPGLLHQIAAFDGPAWLRGRGWAARPEERVASLFCYDSAPVRGLLQALGERPTLLLVTPGAATRAWRAACAQSPCPPGLRALELPWLSQYDYDRLLWSCELNFVRGEDSFVRAQWAGAPFVWQIYPQHDHAHVAKLDAFLGRLLQEADPVLGAALRRLWLSWNGLDDNPLRLPPALPWKAQAQQWRERLSAQPDLVTQLLEFAAGKR